MARCFLAVLYVALTSSAPIAAANSPPRFEDFSVSGTYGEPLGRPILDTPSKMEYRTRIRAAAARSPNFAGEFVLSTWGCGTGCQQFVIVNPHTGYVLMAPFAPQGGETMYADGENWERIDWRPNSRLLIVNGKVTNDEKELDAHHYYIFDGRELHYLAKEKGKPQVEATKESSPQSLEVPKTEPAASLPPLFFGKWASTFKECRDPTDGLVDISAKLIHEHESYCDIIKLEHTGIAWTAITDCSFGGEQWASRYELTISGDAIAMKSDKGRQAALLRCP